MNNPYRNLLAALKATGATLLLSDVGWTTLTPAPCGCLFGTVMSHQVPEYDPPGLFRNSWAIDGSPLTKFAHWAHSIGLTRAMVEELERFNDGLFAEEIVEAADESVQDVLDEIEIDFDRYASERYRLVVAHLEEKAAKFDREHEASP